MKKINYIFGLLLLLIGGLLILANFVAIEIVWDNLWPIYPLGVAIGLLQAYLFGGREKGLLISVGI